MNKVLVICACLLFGMIEADQARTQRAGKIRDGYYVPPSKDYRIEIPKEIEGMKINGGFSRETDWITIMGDYGELFTYEIINIEEIEHSELFLEMITSTKYYKCFFKEAIFEFINNKFPHTALLMEEIVDDFEMNKIFFAMVNIPGGSTMLNLEKKQYHDSLRGYLLSADEKNLYIVSVQMPLPIYNAYKVNFSENEFLKKSKEYLFSEAKLARMRLSKP